jgi:hypothetical protein
MQNFTICSPFCQAKKSLLLSENRLCAPGGAGIFSCLPERAPKNPFLAPAARAQQSAFGGRTALQGREKESWEIPSVRRRPSRSDSEAT